MNDTLSSDLRVQRLIFSFFPHTPTQGQQLCCQHLVRFLYDPDPLAAFLLMGYAGTGKTSLVSALIAAAPYLHIRTQLLAPTGRAAKVLSAYSHAPALTIHKKIYCSTVDENGLLHCALAPNKHSYTLFIVDEVSMIGLDDASDGSLSSQRSLLDDLVAYVTSGSHCRLLLMGDGAQLPPVGCDVSPALDVQFLSSAYPLHFASFELTEVVRQQAQSGILAVATTLRNALVALPHGASPSLPLFSLDDYSDVRRLDGSDLLEVLYSEYDRLGLDQVVLVTRSNKRAILFNQAIRNRVLLKDDEVNAGDYLMVVRNNYFWLDDDRSFGNGFIANGDIVEVLSLRRHVERYGFHFVDASLRFVDYDDAPVIEATLLLDTLHSASPSLTLDESRALYSAVYDDYAHLPSVSERRKAVRNNPYFNALQVKFAYALTCHKTQGGQWHSVIIDQGFFSDDMLDQAFLRWLYTALTRATARVYLLNFSPHFFSSPPDTP